MIGDRHLVRVGVSTRTADAWPSILAALDEKPLRAELVDQPPIGKRVIAYVWVDTARWAAKDAAEGIVRDRLAGVDHTIEHRSLREPPVRRREARELLFVSAVLVLTAFYASHWGPISAQDITGWSRAAGVALLSGVAMEVVAKHTPRGRAKTKAYWVLVSLLFAAVFAVCTFVMPHHGVVIAVGLLVIIMGWHLAFGQRQSKLLEVSIGVLPLLGSGALAMSGFLWRAFLDDFGLPASAVQVDWYDRLYLTGRGVLTAAAVMFLLGSLLGWLRYVTALVLGRTEMVVVTLGVALVVAGGTFTDIWHTRVAEFVQVQTDLANGRAIDGVFSDELQWVCASPVADAHPALQGGVAVRDWTHPVVHVLSGDDHVWLWEPSRPVDGRVSRRAVGYPADAVVIQAVRPDGISPVVGTDTCPGR